MAKTGENSDLTWTTGIAEVALPIDFKLKNIEATEAARKKQLEDRQAQRELQRIVKNQKTLCLGNTTTAMIRKQQQDKWKSENMSNGSGVGGGEGKPGTMSMGVSRQGVTGASSFVSSNTSSEQPPAGYEKSSDDFAVGKFLRAASRRLNR